MKFFTFTLRLILAVLGFAQSLARAGASSIEQLGEGSPGIDSMWSQLKQIFPHTDVGSGGLGFIVLMLINIILRLIGGVAALFIVYGGIRMMMTVADENAHSEAKKVVLYACLGLVLAIGTDAVIMYVMSLVKTASGG